MDRRTSLISLGSLVSASLAGCIFSENSDIPDVLIENESSEKQEISIEISNPDNGDTIFSEEVVVDSSDSTSFEDPITEPGKYEVNVMTGGGLNNKYTWELPTNDEAEQLNIIVNSQSISFQILAA